MAAPLLTRRITPLIRSQKPISSFARTMASSASSERTFEYLVVAPDRPGMLSKRLEVRPTHFKELTPRFESGQWRMGGGLLNSVPEDDKDASKMDFHGSTFVIAAKSKDEVISLLKSDIYATSGVWDMEKVQIWPLLCGFRKALE